MLFQRSSSPSRPTITGRKVSNKRRKLEALAVSPSSATATTYLPPFTVSTSKNTSCGTCYRVIRGPLAHPHHQLSHILPLIACRCKQEVCSICSRICVGWPSSAVIPSESTTNVGLRRTQSTTHKRPPLNMAQTNAVVNTSIVGKRRKPSALDESVADDGGEGLKSDLLAGCSRSICRNCCVEASHGQASMCYDCRDRLLQSKVQEDTSNDDTVHMIEV
ncbi:hypothetical protein BXZ70DRAFT_524059 [Cristinia sonorae]|uniref:Uncharacterized protein n=1 Tax=Cristinia sonorae TaxID=1940300 RepID=A0A8K0XTC6_9AGAR|nr:hypothetical protein BXZ70DRAFT_524059 [Cristinia sonorae]